MKTSENKQSAKKSCLSTNAKLCGCVVLYGLFTVLSGIIFFHHTRYYEASGEHIAVPSYYPPDASDYCFFESSAVRYCEFNLRKDSFLKYSKEKEWDIVDIETTNVFFICYYNNFNMKEKREYKTEKPFTITRYIHQLKPEHLECSQQECKIDATGLTENACVRSILKGYFYKTTNGASRGITVLYDSEKERCYIKYSLR